MKDYEEIVIVSINSSRGGGTKRISFQKFLKKYSEKEIVDFIAADRIRFLDKYGGIIPIEKAIAVLPTVESSSYPRGEAKPTVFISYCSEDRAIAHKLKEELEKWNVRVRMDEQDLGFTKAIQEYLVEFIKTSDFTLCIISSNSLLSGWVGFEILTALTLELDPQKSKFIACSVDREWSDWPFLEKWATAIDQKVNELEEIRRRQIELRIAVDAIDKEMTRLQNLRNNAGQIIARLREFRTENISDENWDSGVIKILEALNTP